MTDFKKYPAYKDSGVEWIGEVPDDWNLLRGNYVFKVINERSKKGTEELLSVSEHHGVRPRSESNVNMFMAESYEGYKLCRQGDLVINSLWAWSRGLGISKYDGIISTAYSVYRPDHNRYDKDFLNYLLRTEIYVAQYLIASKGIWISRLQLSDWLFLRLPILAPSKSEQTRIAAFLDRKTAQIDQAIAQKERLIELLKERRQILIHNAVTRGLDPNVKMKDSGVEWIGMVPEGWELTKLGFYALSIQTGPFGSQLHSHDYVEGGIPVINPSHIVEGEIIPDISQSITSSKFQELKHHTLNAGDIVFGRRGEMGRCALVHFGDRPMICGTGSIKITLDKNKIYPNYLNQYLKIGVIKDWFSLNSVGSTMENLNSSILSLVPILIPSIQEQIAISTFIETITQKIATAITLKQAEIEKLKEYKATLINSAVTGKIKVV